MFAIALSTHSVGELVSQSVSESISQSVIQSVSHSVSQSFSQSVSFWHADDNTVGVALTLK